jgi:hypothetical protein
MVITNGTLLHNCYCATNATDAHIGCVPTVSTRPYRCVGQFANTAPPYQTSDGEGVNVVELLQRWSQLVLPHCKLGAKETRNIA